ncbi:MAG: cytosine deaminase, partial [Verrucomicrobiae bacterium]|nr:cytosine deaminase [Verrucomicrobiae bacterium]
TMQGPPLDGGCVVVKGQRIAAVTRCAEKVDLDLGDAVLFPGLINAHCHLDYTSLAGQVPWQGDFREWLLQLTALKKKLAADDYLRSIQKGLANLMQTATTSL